VTTSAISVGLLLDGVDQSGYVDGYVTISQGRQDGTTPFGPMSCSFTLADIPGTPRPYLGQPVSVYANTDGIVRLRFAGRITDVSYSGEVATITAVSSAWWALNACGPNVSTVAAAGAPVGQVRDVVYQLAAINPVLTGLLPDTPAGFWNADRAAQIYTSDTYTRIISEIVADAPFGLLYEQPGGQLVYTDVSTRENAALSSTTWLTIDGDMILKPVSASMSLQDVQNSISVSYVGGTVTATDATSVSAYGQRPASYSTQMSDPVRVQVWADYQLRNGALTRYRGNSLTVPLAGSTVTAADRALAAAVAPGGLVNTPYARPFSSATRMFVEGYTERWAKGDWLMTLNLTDPQISGAFETWDTLYFHAPTLQWQNAGAPSTNWNQLLYTNL